MSEALMIGESSQKKDLKKGAARRGPPKGGEQTICIITMARVEKKIDLQKKGGEARCILEFPQGLSISSKQTPRPLPIYGGGWQLGRTIQRGTENRSLKHLGKGACPKREKTRCKRGLNRQSARERSLLS